jgi:hypothetical protein
MPQDCRSATRQLHDSIQGILWKTGEINEQVRDTGQFSRLATRDQHIECETEGTEPGLTFDVLVPKVACTIMSM